MPRGRPRKDCKAGYERVGKTCRKLCKANQDRFADTGRCRKAVRCTANQERNPETNRCRKICPNGRTAKGHCKSGRKRGVAKGTKRGPRRTRRRASVRTPSPVRSPAGSMTKASKFWQQDISGFTKVYESDAEVKRDVDRLMIELEVMKDDGDISDSDYDAVYESLNNINDNPSYTIGLNAPVNIYAFAYSEAGI
jgi:hypothetical protein